MKKIDKLHGVYKGKVVALYHPRARYIDCTLAHKDHCEKCGWVADSRNKNK